MSDFFWDPMDRSLPGSSVYGILWARILEWVAMASSRVSFRPRDQTQVSRIAGRFFTIWATWEAPLFLYYVLIITRVCMLSCFSHVWLFETPWTVALQAPLSMEFSRQEDWSGLLCPPAGDLPDLGIEPTWLLYWQAESLLLSHWGSPSNIMCGYKKSCYI